MMPPTSIDGTDITGATIDGTDVQEITVDGDTVFTAGTLPVAYSNLIAWYPFDSSFYGGSDTDDVTATFNPGQSGDSTAYDLTSDGNATYNSSGGATDINAGSSSGYYETNKPGKQGFANTAFSETVNDFTVMFWLEQNNTTDNDHILALEPTEDRNFIRQRGGGGLEIAFEGNSFFVVTFGITTGELYHVAFRNDGGSSELFINGQSEISGTMNTSTTFDAISIGSTQRVDNPADVYIDDLRLYTAALSDTQINQIYKNTEP